LYESVVFEWNSLLGSITYDLAVRDKKLTCMFLVILFLSQCLSV